MAIGPLYGGLFLLIDCGTENIISCEGGIVVEITDMRISEIAPYDGNPRINDEAVEYVANSIREFGFKVPIIVDSNGVIVAGHTRYKAAIELGMDTVPCIVADDLTDDQVRAFRIADNKVSEIAEWDDDLLSIELDGIIDIDMDLFGFDVGPDDGSVEDERDETIPGENGFEYEEIYAINVVCKDEADQKKTFDKLTSMGYECKVVVV